MGKIGEVRAWPFTVLGQFRFFESTSPLRPYLGAGLTYAKFYKARSTAALSALTGGTPANPTTLSVKSKLAATVQLGASFAFSERWFVDANATRTFLKTRTGECAHCVTKVRCSGIAHRESRGVRLMQRAATARRSHRVARYC